MKTRAVILAGGEGSRLSVLTTKRTKPAVPFGGKYRIIDFPLSNCTNSNIFDVMIIAQYRPHSLIEHIGSGGPWDMNRELDAGVRLYTPYVTRENTNWFLGTADAVQQNMSFVKSTNPDLILILSGDHIYQMNYDAMIQFHLDQKADVTLATFRVPIEEASRFGIVATDENYRVTSFIEKPENPPSNLVNMGVYLFNYDVLSKSLWEDSQDPNSNRDFGKNVLPKLVADGARVFSYPFNGYWIDVGTIDSYWKAHMDLVSENPPINLNDRSWIIHTRTEEQPPVKFGKNSSIYKSMITDGCVIGENVTIEKSILSPGVIVEEGAIIRESIILTDSVIGAGTVVEKAILDKRVKTGKNSIIGKLNQDIITTIGKNSILPDNALLHPGAKVRTDITPKDFPSKEVQSGQEILSTRLPYEI